MRVSSAFVRGFIRNIQRSAAASASTFSDVLNQTSDRSFDLAAKGKILVGTASGGTSVSFALPSTKDVTGGDIAEICSEIADAIDIIKGLNPAITEAELVADLLALFVPITSETADFSGRCHPL